MDNLETVVAFVLDRTCFSGAPDSMQTVAPSETGRPDDDRHLGTDGAPRTAHSIALKAAHGAGDSVPVVRDDEDQLQRLVRRRGVALPRDDRRRRRRDDARLARDDPEEEEHSGTGTKGLHQARWSANG